MRALIVTNMYPSPGRPAFGSFVRDQVEALRRIPGIDVEVLPLAAGSAKGYLKAPAQVRRAVRARPVDIIHAHFGLSAWPALAGHAHAYVATLHGTDLEHPRTRAITLTALPFLDLVATVSAPLAQRLPRRLPLRRTAVLPSGVSLERFRPLPREEARQRLGLDPQGRYLLFPADPRRPEKRHDRALAVAQEIPLLHLGTVAPEQVPLYVNAANAVVVPSEREGFGLAVLEALACDVPVLSTPVGIAPEVLGPTTAPPGCLCAPFDLRAWRAAILPHLEVSGPRIEGRRLAALYSTDVMARRVQAEWFSLLGSAAPDAAEERPILGAPGGS